MNRALVYGVAYYFDGRMRHCESRNVFCGHIANGWLYECLDESHWVRSCNDSVNEWRMYQRIRVLRLTMDCKIGMTVFDRMAHVWLTKERTKLNGNEWLWMQLTNVSMMTNDDDRATVKNELVWDAHSVHIHDRFNAVEEIWRMAWATYESRLISEPAAMTGCLFYFRFSRLSDTCHGGQAGMYAIVCSQCGWNFSLSVWPRRNLKIWRWWR